MVWLCNLAPRLERRLDGRDCVFQRWAMLLLEVRAGDQSLSWSPSIRLLTPACNLCFLTRGVTHMLTSLVFLLGSLWAIATKRSLNTELKFRLLSMQQQHPFNLGFYWGREAVLPKRIEFPEAALLAWAPKEDGRDGAWEAVYLPLECITYEPICFYVFSVFLKLLVPPQVLLWVAHIFLCCFGSCLWILIQIIFICNSGNNIVFFFSFFFSGVLRTKSRAPKR